MKLNMSRVSAAIGSSPVTMTICGVPLALAAVMLIVMSAAPRAQRGRNRGDANQGVPVATNTIQQHPDAYDGKQVTISAGVEQVLSKTAFLIDQWKPVGASEVKAVGRPILVIAPYLTGSLEPRNYLLVRGEIVKFELAPVAIARLAGDYKLDLAPEVGARYQGQPVLLATSVIDSTYTELARKPIPPPTASEISMTE